MSTWCYAKPTPASAEIQLAVLSRNYYNIIIIKFESAVQGQERVRTLYQSEDLNSTQPTHGIKKTENCWRQKERADYGQQESIGSALN